MDGGVEMAPNIIIGLTKDILIDDVLTYKNRTDAADGYN
jgi:hypothetical protein